MSRDESLRRLLEDAAVEPSVRDREALLAAAEPILAEHARRARGRRAGRPGFLGRIAGALAARPRRALALAAGVALLVAVLVPRRETRDARSAQLRTWAEHVKEDPGRPFPLASASFLRAY